jgi:hypothetical protein
MAAQSKKKSELREAQLRERAASRNYTLEKDGKAWYAERSTAPASARWRLDEVDEFLPKES